jgi:hypothetical protein
MRFEEAQANNRMFLQGICMFFQGQRGPHVWASVASKHASHNKANMQTKRDCGERVATGGKQPNHGGL